MLTRFQVFGLQKHVIPTDFTAEVPQNGNSDIFGIKSDIEDSSSKN